LTLVHDVPDCATPAWPLEAGQIGDFDQNLRYLFSVSEDPTQGALAAKTSIGRTTLSRLMSGERSPNTKNAFQNRPANARRQMIEQAIEVKA
jgi:hypothetical protein